MITVDDIRDWLGQSVVDVDGAKIGSMEGVYYDTRTDEPAFASVKVGLSRAGAGWCSSRSPVPTSPPSTSG